MGVNNLPRTVIRQRRGCDLNPGPTAPESSTLTARLPSHPRNRITLEKKYLMGRRADSRPLLYAFHHGRILIGEGAAAGRWDSDTKLDSYPPLYGHLAKIFRVRVPIYETSYDLSQDYLTFIVRSICDGDLERANISVRNIVS